MLVFMIYSNFYIFFDAGKHYTLLQCLGRTLYITYIYKYTLYVYIYIYFFFAVHWNTWNMDLNHPQNNTILTLKSRDTRFLYIYMHTHAHHIFMNLHSILVTNCKSSHFSRNIYSKLPRMLRWVTLGSNLLMAGLHPLPRYFRKLLKNNERRGHWE